MIRRCLRSIGKWEAVILAVILVLFVLPAFSEHVKVDGIQLIENPKPTHTEKTFQTLKLIKTISIDIDDENFMAMPFSITVDDRGNIFVYDRILVTIFKFDNKFRFVKRFGKKGRGPREIGVSSRGGGFSIKKLNISTNNRLLVSDPANRKIMAYNTDGTFLAEYPIFKEKYLGSFYPIIDGKNNFYILSSNGGAVDVLDIDSKEIHTFLCKEKMLRCFADGCVGVPNKNKSWFVKYISQPIETSVYYDILPRNRFIIYLAYSSTMYLFDNFELVKSVDIVPGDAMDTWLKEVAEGRETEKTIKKRMSKKGLNSMRTAGFGYFPLFKEFFMDKDDQEHFYLRGYRDKQGNRDLLYKFDLDGKLIKVLYYSIGKIQDYCNIREKRNHLFYGLGGNNIYIFKEEKK